MKEEFRQMIFKIAFFISSNANIKVQIESGRGPIYYEINAVLANPV